MGRQEEGAEDPFILYSSNLDTRTSQKRQHFYWVCVSSSLIVSFQLILHSSCLKLKELTGQWDFKLEFEFISSYETDHRLTSCS